MNFFFPRWVASIDDLIVKGVCSARIETRWIKSSEPPLLQYYWCFAIITVRFNDRKKRDLSWAGYFGEPVLINLVPKRGRIKNTPEAELFVEELINDIVEKIKTANSTSDSLVADIDHHSKIRECK